MLIKKSLFQYLIISGAIVLLSLATMINLHREDSKSAGSSSQANVKNVMLNLEATPKADKSSSEQKNQHLDAEINRRIQALESSLKGLRAQLASKQNNEMDSQAREELNDADDDPVKTEREKTTKLVSYLDQQMHMEKIDTDWNESTKAEIAAAFAGLGFISKVECHSTLCRILADHESQDAERNFITQLTGLKAFINTDAFIERNEHEDGSVSTQIFIARSNHRLPDPGTAL